MTQISTPESSPFEERTDASPDSSTAAAAAAAAPPQFPVTLVDPSKRNRKLVKRPAKLFRRVRTAFRAFPILTTPSNVCCRPHMPLGGGEAAVATHRISGSKRLTGTLFGHRKARITLALQDSPRSVPILLLELTVPTAKFMTDMGSSGSIRVALECEKKADQKGTKIRLLNEPAWTAFINGKNIGYGMRREPTEGDLQIMQMLHATSMGAGVLPEAMTDPVDGELTYMRAHFDRVVGSKDSETFYMLNPDGNTGPELSVFFVRI